MKNLKKLSAAFMLAALLSSSLTSCIDNEVSPLVESIYANQAELLAAQAAVQNANATLVLAQAAVQEANAANQAAITAAFTASSAQSLLAQIAATELAVEEARIAMLLAQAEFDQDMGQILAAIRTAQNNEAGQHAADYVTAMSAIATLNGTKLTTQQSIATKELYMKSVTVGSEMTWAVYLAGLEADVLAKQASVIANEEFIVRANAYLDGDYAAMVDALAVATAAQTAKQGEIDALTAEDTQIDADIVAVTGNFDKFQSDFETLETTLATTISNKEAKEDDIETLTTVTIPAIETAIADYAGTTTTLTATETAALAAEVTAGENVDAAELALGTVEAVAAVAGDDAIVDAETLYELLWNAQLVLADANAAWTVLDAAVTALNGTYQTAIADFATAQATYDAGAVALVAAFDAAELALTTGEGLVATNQLDYDAKKAAFELNPTGFVWTAGVDTVLGIHPTAVGPHASYSVVTAITPVVVGAVNVSAGSGADLTALGTYASFLAGTMDGGGAEVVAVNDYYNVGADDVAGGTNGDRLDAALVALTSALDAIPALETAVSDAQDDIDNADQNLADAEALYFAQRDLYEGQVALLEAAVDAQEAATDAIANVGETGAQDNIDAAELALGTVEAVAAVAGDDAIEDAETLYELLWNAELAALDATAAKDLHLATTLATYEANLVTEQANLVEAQNYVAEYIILITRAEADIAALQAEYDALVATPLYAAQQVRILEIVDELAVLNAEKAVLDAEVTALALTVMFEGLTSTGAINTAITTAQGIIDGAPAALDILAAQIAQGEVSVDNLATEIAKLTADLADLDARIAAKTVEADGYLALLNAALGN